MPWGRDHVASGFGHDQPQRKPGMGEDVVRSGGAGLLQGGASVVGARGDLSHMGGQAAAWIIDKITGKKFDPAIFQHMLQPAVNLASYGGAGPLAAPSPPTTSQVVSVLPKQARDAASYQPKTVPGEYARTAGQFATNAIVPGGPLTKAASVLVPAVASESAGQLTKGTKYEQAARIAAALAGGAAVGLAGAGGPSGADKTIANATRGLDDGQIAAVQKLMDEANSRGVKITLAEAVQQVTNGATAMGGVQRYIEGTSPGKEHVGPVMAARPEQTRQAALQVLDQIAPETTDAAGLELRGQQAAQGALTDIRKGINARASPSYEALKGQEIPPADYQQLASEPGYAKALAALRGDPVLNADVAALPDRNLSVVNEVTKQLDALESGARVGPNNPGGNNTLAGKYAGSRANVDALIDALTQGGQVPADWRNARQIVAQGRQSELAPMTAGPLGEISGAKNAMNPPLNAAQQGAKLYPTAPPEGQPGMTRQALQGLGTQDPTVGADLTRAHLAQVLAESGQDLRGGPNPWGGANFAAAVAGNPVQRDTLMTGLQEVAPGTQQEMDKLIQVLQATGRREAAGSPTAPNLEMAEDLKANTRLAGNIATGATGPRLFERLQRAIEAANLEMNSRELAQALLTDEPASVLTKAMQAAPPDELRRRLLMHAMLNTEASSKETH